MNEPNVPMYRNAITHRCGSRRAAMEPARSDLALDRLSMYFQAPNAAIKMSGTQIQPASGRLRVAAAAVATASGTTSCATAAPRFPPAAFRPSAQPFSRTG